MFPDFASNKALFFQIGREKAVLEKAFFKRNFATYTKPLSLAAGHSVGKWKENSG